MADFRQRIVQVVKQDAELTPDITPAPDGSVIHVDRTHAIDNGDGAGLLALIPDAADTYTTTIQINNPELPIDIPDAGNTARPFIPEITPELNIEVPDAGNAYVLQGNTPRAELLSDISDAPDTRRVQTPEFVPELNIEVPDVPNTQTMQMPVSAPELNIEIADAPNTQTVQTPVSVPELNVEVPDVPNAIINTPLAVTPELNIDVPSAPETQRIQVPQPSPDLNIEVSPAPDAQRIVVAPQTPELPINIPDTGDDRDQRFQTSFDGAWIPDGSGINVGPKNFQTLRNLRYRPDGLEGIDGTSYINTNATGKYLKNGVQLLTNYTQRSYILAQGEDSDGTDKILIKNTQTVPTAQDFDGVTTVYLPISYTLKLWRIYDGTETSGIVTLTVDSGTYTGTTLASHIQTRINANSILTHNGDMSYVVAYAGSAFTITATGGTVAYNSGSTVGTIIGFTANQGPSASITSDTAVAYATAYFTEDASASRARFSKLPQGHIGFCDQKANKIWAGDEMSVGAFLYGTEATHVITSSNDLVEFTTGGGTASIDIADETYTGDTLAAQIQTKLRAEGTLAIPAATCEYRLGKFYIDAGSGKTIKCTSNGDGAPFTGFDVDSGSGARILWSPSAWTPSAGGGWGHVAYFDALQDVTEAVNNSLATTGNTVTIASGTTYKHFYVLSHRPLQGMKITTTSGSFTTANLSGTYFNGEKMATLASLAVSTASSVDTVTWTDTSTTAKPIYVNGYYMFCYRFVLLAGSASVTVSQVTVNAGFQVPVDIWDGIPRTCKKFLYVVEASGEYTEKDYTLEMANIEARDFSASSTTASDLGQLKIGTLNAASAGDYIEAWFDEPQCAFKWVFSVPEDTGDVYSLSVSFWDGTQYVGSRTVYDTLKDIGDNFYFGTSGGVNFFEIPLYDNTGTAYAGMESISEKNGAKGYRYKIQWTHRSTNELTELVMDQFQGIPRYRTLTKNYTFPHMHRNRSMQCACVSDNEKNRVDYSSKNKPDVYNGADASGRFNERSLYFGSKEPLTGAVELFNQFADGLDSVSIFTKATETFILTGDSPADFAVRTLSRSIGCPAPLTLDTAEVAVGASGAARQNVAIWMDANVGPVMSNGGTIQPIVDYNIKRYWTPGSTYAIPAAYVGICAGIYDPNFNEYHLVIPSGSGATTNNTWLIYDLAHGKWRENHMGTSTDFPQAFMRVEDTHGEKYIYAFTDTGFTVRLDYGRTWSDGTAITYTVKTGDALFSQSMWDETMVRRIKVMFDTNAAGYLTVNHYLNGSTTRSSTVGSATAGLPPTATPRTMAYSGYNYRNLILQCAATDGESTPKYYDLRGLSHAFEFIVTNCSAIKPKLLGWAAMFTPTREDSLDKDGY